MSRMRQKLLFQKPPDPDGLHEIADRVYVFISCFGAQQECGEERYKLHVETVVGQFRRTVPEASVLVCNFRDEETKTATFNSHAVMNYPRHHLGCPVLRMKDTWRFLSSCENWLSRGHRDVVLMHCERGAWPVLAFALAALLVFRKQCEGEKQALDKVYEQAPRQLLHSLMAVNQIPSQLRYLRYVATWNRALDLVPLNGVIRLDCIVLKFMPKFDGEGGCGSVLRVHGCDPFVEDGTPKCLYSTPERRKNAWDCEQGDCETIKVNINCHIKGDVLIEIINLNGDTESEQILFRVMFNVAFVGSNILLLNRDKIDVLWYAIDHFPKNFRAEILFSEMDASTALLKNGTLCFEEEGLPLVAFSKWMNPMEDPALNNVPQQKRASPENTKHEKLNTGSNQYVESGSLLHIKGPQMPQAKKNEANFFLSSNMENQFVTSAKQSPDNSMSRKEKTIKADAALPRPSKSDIISHEIPSPFERTLESSNCTNLSIKPHPSDFTLSDSLDISSSCSISPQTPPQLPPLTRSAKEVHDSHSHHHLPSKSRHLTKEIKSQSQDRSHFSSTTGTPVSSTSHNKSPDDSASHSPSSAITSNQSPPLEKILPFRTKLDSSLSQPQTLPSPTPPLKEQEPIRARPPASPPTPPLKEQESIRARPPASPPTSRLKEQKPIRARALASPPIPPLKEQEPIRAKPLASPPTPPTPPLKEQEPSRAKPLASPPTPPPTELEPIRARPLASPPTPPTPPLKEQEPIRARPLASPPTPPTPPLKEHEPIRAGPPPSPPTPPPKDERRIRSGAPPSLPSSPPRPSGEAASSTPIPPPPPAAALFSDHSNSSLQKSLAVPAAPPPPTSFGNGGIQPDNAFSRPLSMGGNGDNVSSTKGHSSIGSKGRILTHTNSMTRTKKLKPLHWLKLSRAVKGSLWAETQKSGEASKAPEINMSELENLFSAAVPSSGPSKKANVQSSVGPKSDKVQLIEHTRAYNCEIVLSKVKVPLHDLMGSVLALEESALDTDQVENLIKFCPTKEEIETLQGYTGEKEKLGRCEQFFLELMKVPRVESKLRVFSFKIQFHSRVSDLRNSLNVVNAAAEEIRNSVKLKRIMQTILSLGNALNQGTAKGSAIGFRLDSLLKLTDTRARNKKITLMHYLCKVLADKLPEVLDFSKDLANLEPAAKIQLKLLAEEMQTISIGLEKVEHERSTSENDGPISETFCKNLKEYLCSAKAEGSSLSSLYSVMGRNVDDLIIYFGEDPCRCPFEQVVTTLHHFTGMLNKAHEENCKQLELEMKKTEETVK